MEDFGISFFYIILILLIAFVLAARQASLMRSNLIYLVLIEHFILSYAFYAYSLSNPADATAYFNDAVNATSPKFGTSTEFIVFISTIFVQYFQLTKIALFFLFGLFGFIGHIYFMKMLKNIGISFLGISAVLIAVLLPQFHFWTSALGKDSLFYMALMIFVYSLRYFNKNRIKLVLSLLLIGLIRPHMAMLILIALILGTFLTGVKKLSFVHIGAFIMLIGVFIVFLPFVMEFVVVDDIETDTIVGRADEYNSYGANKSGGTSSYIDVTSYTLPEKMFAYLFRPLFFDARSILQLMASFENLFLIGIILVWFRRLPIKLIKWYKGLMSADKILTIYVFLSWIILSMNMYNLGLASRQKFMVVPIILLLIFNEHKYIELDEK